MKKIILAGLINDTNIGDLVIYDNTKFLVEKALKELNIVDYEIDSIDLTGKSKETKKETYDFDNNKKVRKDFFKKIIAPELKTKLRYLKHRFFINNKKIDEELTEYYEKSLKDADLVIFVGGGIIKYLYQDFYRYISLIINICEKNDIDVIINSAGIEGYSKKNKRCQRLKKALNKDCVKTVTTRDNFELLKNNYIENENIIIGKVADPAVWSYEVYNKNIDLNKKGVIGLGVIRPGIFKDHGIDFNEEKQLKLWSNIIKELDKKGYSWQLFTNGLKDDYQFAEKILKYMSIEDESKLVDMPRDGGELINIISKYKGVIAARMHANIISYSLDIPSVGIVWNDKLKMFGENIQVEDRFVTFENFNAKCIVEKLEEGLKNGYNFNKKQYGDTVYQTLKDAINLVFNK